MPNDPNDRQVLTGMPFGALRFASLNKLFGGQRAALTAIVEAIHRIAADSYARRRGKPAGTPCEKDLLSLDQASYFDRPHHAYVVDGERGSGKTTVLLTLYGYIKAMRFDNAQTHATHGSEDGIRGDLAAMRLPPIPSLTGAEKTALLLPIVFPETMEPHESAMEAVFAHMDQILVRATAESGLDDGKRRRLDELQVWLRRRIGAAWMYSRKIGEQALMNDALTYDEFVVRRAEHNRLSYTRIDTWRYFVDRYLDELGYEVLVLSFDDSDLVPEAADDIMRTIRVYLSHSRIVSLLAVELRTLHDALSLYKLTQRTPGLLTRDGGRLDDLIGLENSNIAAQIDKILPTGLRYRLESAEDQLDNIFTGGFVNFCQAEFHRAPPREANHRTALSWWLLSRSYGALVSDTVRRIVSVHAGVGRTGYNLDAVLLEYSKFSDIGRAIGGRMSGIRDAVLNGSIRRSGITVDKRDPNSFYYEKPRRFLTVIESLLVEFALDRELAHHGLRTASVPEMARWLEVARGEDGADEPDARTAQSPLFDRIGSLGVASMLPGLVLPRNCLYLSDLRYLEDADRTPPQQSVGWVGRLVARTRTSDEEIRRDLRNAVVDLSALDDATAVRWLHFQFDGLRRGATRFQQSVALRQILRNPTAHPETLLVVLEFVMRGRARTRMDLIAALEAAMDRGPPREHGDVSFALGLTEFLASREEIRRSAAQTWMNALKVAARTRVPGPPAYESISEDGAALVNGSALFERTIEALNEISEPRVAALLGWSVEACLTPAFDLGFTLREASPTKQQWERLMQALQAANETLRIPSAREGRSSQTRRNEQRWRFPDIKAADIRAIGETVDGTLSTLSRRLAAEAPAGTETGTRWPSDSLEFMAQLLGMTVAAVEDSSVLHAG